MSTIKKVAEGFKGVEGRLEFLRKVKGISVYNDTTATTPEATIVALKSLGNEQKRNVILIMGGADKNLNMSRLVEIIPVYCKRVILLPGTGTNRLINEGSFSGDIFTQVKNLDEALFKAFEFANKGDVIIFSPAFASFGMFKNEYDRGEKFNLLVKKLK
jgi:UDP-N-acetylmuramoylalanine--D-glutamate ligase